MLLAARAFRRDRNRQRIRVDFKQRLATTGVRRLFATNDFRAY
jgi:hypothetical protein